MEYAEKEKPSCGLTLCMLKPLDSLFIIHAPQTFSSFEKTVFVVGAFFLSIQYAHYPKN